MLGERNLNQLLLHLEPQLAEEAYVYVRTTKINSIPFRELFALIKEAEGYTLILEKQIADQRQLDYEYVAAKITIQVHSSLEAVGLTAALSGQLAKAGISCNVIAAYYHDHLFVNFDQRIEAIKTLQALS
jgi:hypothetical protein